MIRPGAPSTKVTLTPECPFCLPKWSIRILIPNLRSASGDKHDLSTTTSTLLLEQVQYHC